MYDQLTWILITMGVNVCSATLAPPFRSLGMHSDLAGVRGTIEVQVVEPGDLL